MRRFVARADALLFPLRRDPSSFPVSIQRAVARSVVSVVVILLISVGSAPRGIAQAQTLVALPPTSESAADPYGAFVREAARRFGVPASWISAVMAMESGGNVRAVSSHGAMGLMQIMPDTWAGLRVRHGLGADPYDPRDNILAGAAYLREMHDRYGSPGFLAAYNAGPARYDEYLASGRELPPETQLYVAWLAPLIGGGLAKDRVAVSWLAVSWRDSPLFVARHGDEPQSTPSSVHTAGHPSSNSESAAGVSTVPPQVDGVFVRRGNANRLP